MRGPRERRASSLRPWGEVTTCSLHHCIVSIQLCPKPGCRQSHSSFCLAGWRGLRGSSGRAGVLKDWGVMLRGVREVDVIVVFWLSILELLALSVEGDITVAERGGI